MKDSELRRLATSRPALAILLVAAAAMAPIVAILFQAPHLIGATRVMSDFDAFHVAGLLALRGEAAAAYDAAQTMAAQQAFTGTPNFMPWTYPPPYMLIVRELARLPIGFGYLLFIALSFGFYLLVLRRIAGEFLPSVLIAAFPTIAILLRSGQNGFLIGGLVGLSLLAFRENRATAGIPLGLLILKPHLAAGAVLPILLERRWGAIGFAALVSAGALLAATLAFGPEIWPAFRDGAKAASEFLTQEGAYPLYRMSSIYAFVKSLGGSAAFALTLHGLGAATALGLFVLVWRSKAQPMAFKLAAACVASLFVSPYNYDYDLTILGVALAFLIPGLIQRASGGELVRLCALFWLTTSYGLFIGDEMRDAPALIAPALLLLIGWSVAILRRAESGSDAAEPAGAELRPS